ncbi:pyridoxamine 5'-phosphate oxidase family protein [Nocardioides donggukensis]|uniref:Pyridoxamine 5'-phosphate oxidase family protein n=1 Tax=Nocardioides donggukensis TaxID=2774019 RepID=A0A927K705_9ACTN|nr:pyridoxamine 5'-phosphate oxidase family protein [Nocardioides donggukensis]MBD8870173.1 pyridoxamine 5'-phosphate oxidase family protein [Nocardioides donggukensis]
MSGTSIWEGGRIVELDPEECWQLLATRAVGRIAWSAADGQTVIPVNFTAADGAVWVRTTAYSTMAREGDGRAVAFEVDDLDDFTRSGWSVLVRGTARLVYPTEDRPEAWTAPDTWPAGPRTLDLVVEATRVTGRRLLPS